MSKLRKILTNFGFETKEKQMAFLENLYFAEYFFDDQIWQMLNLIQYNEDNQLNYKLNRDLKKDFRLIQKITNSSGANQANHRLFRAQFLLDNLFNQDEFDDFEYIEDLMLYIAQNAFARAKNQERVDLKKSVWMYNYYEKYINNARKLQLIDSLEPRDENIFDETWVQGAARTVFWWRLQHAKELQDRGIKTGTIRLLTGARELWLEIDDIGYGAEETMQYIKYLAQKFAIKLDENNPFIEVDFGGLIRTYPNYAAGHDPQKHGIIDEAMMARDLYHKVFGKNIAEDLLTDSKAAPGKSRPDTFKAAQDTAKNSLQKQLGQGGEFFGKIPNIMVLSNQPYTMRQNLAVARAVRSIISDEIEFHPIGKECVSEVARIHSELATLAAEGYMIAREKNNIVPKIPLDNILFSTRCQDFSLVEPLAD